MKFYFVTDQYFGNEMVLEPRIPETIQENEDNKTKRICVSTSIIGALSATSQNLEIGEPTFVYETDIPIDSKNLIQPNQTQVFDAEYTGEFWVTKKNKFKLIKMVEVIKQIPIDIDNTPTHICEFKEIL